MCSPWIRSFSKRTVEATGLEALTRRVDNEEVFLYPVNGVVRIRIGDWGGSSLLRALHEGVKRRVFEVVDRVESVEGQLASG